MNEWQTRQAAECSCKGSDDMCPCQNVDRSQPRAVDDWRLPYRSMDASGSPESAAQVGWDWLQPILRAEHDRNPAGLELDHPRIGSEGGATCLYRNCKLIASAIVIRDPMNFAVLIRWRAPC